MSGRCPICQRPTSDVQEQGACFETGAPECRRIGDSILEMVNIAGPAVLDILAERVRQVKVEGFENSRDDQYANDELARASALYILPSRYRRGKKIEAIWPWAREWWKPGARYRDMVKGAALALAEAGCMHRRGETE